MHYAYDNQNISISTDSPFFLKILRSRRRVAKLVNDFRKANVTFFCNLMAVVWRLTSWYLKYLSLTCP